MNSQPPTPEASILRRYRELETEHDEFLDAFSHDFAASLRQARQFARLLLSRLDVAPGSDEERFAALMDQAMRRSDDMLNAVLELVRATARNDAPVPVDCVPLIERVLASFAADDVSLTYEGPDAAVIRGDAAQVHDLFRRLVDNTLRYRREGVSPVVRVSAAPLGTGWRFAVDDNGPGFGTERIDGVFRLFRNIDSAERNTRVGLGLPVCRTIVRQHDGDIRCARSAPGDTSLVFSLGAPLPAER